MLGNLKILIRDFKFIINIFFKHAYTKAASDWKLKLVFECENELKAKKLERFIKRMKSRNFIIKIIEQPSILKDVLKNKL